MVKGVSEIDRPECCPECGGQALRDFAPTRVYLSGTAVQNAEYNPGLGCVVKNKAHREELCKRRGLVEVGNDYGSGEKLQTSFDTARAEKRAREWDEL